MFKDRAQIQKNIICKSCKQDSGWSNSDMLKIPTDKDRNLTCSNCGDVCIKIRANILREEEFQNEREFFAKQRLGSKPYNTQKHENQD